MFNFVTYSLPRGDSYFMLKDFSITCLEITGYGPKNSYEKGEVAYRFGFQGQEKYDEIKGAGNSINYKYRMHDPRLGRFLSLDPLAPDYPHNSPYAFSENSVIGYVELEGLEKAEPAYKKENEGYTTAIDVTGTGDVTEQQLNTMTATYPRRPNTKQEPLFTGELDDAARALLTSLFGDLEKELTSQREQGNNETTAEEAYDLPDNDGDLKSATSKNVETNKTNTSTSSTNTDEADKTEDSVTFHFYRSTLRDKSKRNGTHTVRAQDSADTHEWFNKVGYEVENTTKK